MSDFPVYRRNAVRLFTPLCIQKWDNKLAAKNKRLWDNSERMRPNFDYMLEIRIKRLGKY